MSASRGGELDMLVRFDNLARAVHRWSDGAETEGMNAPARESSAEPAWVALEPSGSKAGRALRLPTGTRGRRRLLMVVAGAGAALVGLTLLRGFGASPRQLSFVVAQGEPSAPQPGLIQDGSGSAPLPAVAGTVVSGTQPARISFSDGSTVVLEPGSRGTVVGTSERGARVRVETGRAHVSVAHLLGARWSVEAGPFVVVVRGTVFDVSWSEATGVLSVDLITGAVTVEAPAHPSGTGKRRIPLDAGQRLTARASTGETRVVSRAAPVTEGVARESVVAESVKLAPAPAGVGGVGSSSPDRRSGARAQGFHRPATTASSGVGAGPRLAASVTALPTASVSRWAAWPARVAAGSFQSVVAEADALGIERCMAQAPVGSLSALADAARYVRRTDLARRALLAARRRFTGSAAAHDAAFLIGRLADDVEDDTREALLWYDRYLEEGDRGTYAAEALGRKMVTLDRLGDAADARSTARRYLQRYPTGAFANRATRLQGAR